MSGSVNERVSALEEKVDLLFDRLGIDVEAVKADAEASTERGIEAAPLAEPTPVEEPEEEDEEPEEVN